MKMPYLIISLIIICSAVAEEKPAEVLNMWKGAMRSSGLDAINDRVIRLGIKWPEVRSRMAAERLDEEKKALNSEYGQLSDGLLKRLNDAASTVDVLNGRRVLAVIDALLATRDWISQAPSYQNLVLVDTINRHVLVLCLNSLQMKVVDGEGIVQRLKRLREFKFSIVLWGGVLESESDYINKEDLVAIEKLGVVDAFRVIDKYVKPTKVRTLEQLKQFNSESLLKGQDLGVLENRLIVTDYYLASVMYDLIRYWKSAVEPSVADDYQKIRTVLGKDVLIPESIGASLIERRRSAAAVYELFGEVKGGTIYGFFFPGDHNNVIKR